MHILFSVDLKTAAIYFSYCTRSKQLSFGVHRWQKNAIYTINSRWKRKRESQRAKKKHRFRKTHQKKETAIGSRFRSFNQADIFFYFYKIYSSFVFVFFPHAASHFVTVWRIYSMVFGFYWPRHIYRLNALDGFFYSRIFFSASILHPVLGTHTHTLSSFFLRSVQSDRTNDGVFVLLAFYLFRLLLLMFFIRFLLFLPACCGFFILHK